MDIFYEAILIIMYSKVFYFAVKKQIFFKFLAFQTNMTHCQWLMRWKAGVR